MADTARPTTGPRSTNQPIMSSGTSRRPPSQLAAELDEKIERGSAVVGVCGLGYVGLPLAYSVAEKGFSVIGFDIDPVKVERLQAGQSYLPHVHASARLPEFLATGLFQATTDFSKISLVDIVIICVPTPITPQREPDLSFVRDTTLAIAKWAHAGQLIVLESTTYPGTTGDVLRPILEANGLQSGTDIFLAYCPERQDPGNREYDIDSIPRIVAGDDPESQVLAATFYGHIVKTVVAVSSTATAEAVKLTENIFRVVNIALVNELKLIYDKMNIDIWEVIEAAKTKPFGYMPFYPGPGLGGHCIPVDPFYLTWKAREYDLETRFVELAGQINAAMPFHVINRLAESIDRQQGKGLRDSQILIVGLSYKPNIGDVRESPALRLMQLLLARGAEPSYHDPYVPEIPMMREFAFLAGRKSCELRPDVVGSKTAILLATEHDTIDYELLAEHSRLIVDTRNAFGRRGFSGDNLVKA